MPPPPPPRYTSLLIFAGDEGYADCVGKLWDTFLNMLTGVTSFVYVTLCSAYVCVCL